MTHLYNEFIRLNDTDKNIIQKIKSMNYENINMFEKEICSNDYVLSCYINKVSIILMEKRIKNIKCTFSYNTYEIDDNEFFKDDRSEFWKKF